MLLKSLFKELHFLLYRSVEHACMHLESVKGFTYISLVIFDLLHLLTYIIQKKNFRTHSISACVFELDGLSVKLTVSMELVIISFTNVNHLSTANDGLNPMLMDFLVLLDFVAFILFKSIK